MGNDKLIRFQVPLDDLGAQEVHDALQGLRDNSKSSESMKKATARRRARGKDRDLGAIDSQTGRRDRHI